MCVCVCVCVCAATQEARVKRQLEKASAVAVDDLDLTDGYVNLFHNCFELSYKSSLFQIHEF